jgi:hypothetical protein
VTEETALAIIGAIGAAAGNIFVIVKSQMATNKATRAVEANTEATGSQAKLTNEIAYKAAENQKMIREFMAEFRVQASEDRDASLTRAIENVWQTRERVLLARHIEMMEYLHHMLGAIKGSAPLPLSEPAPEARGITNLPPLQDPPKGVPPPGPGWGSAKG